MAHTNNHLGVQQSSTYTIHTGAQRAEAMIIGGRYMNQGNIGLHNLLVEQLRDFMQENGNIVTASLCNGLAHVSAHKEWVRSEDILILGLGILGRSLCVHVANSDALQLVLLAMLCHCVEQDIGRGGSATCEHGITWEREMIYVDCMYA